MLKTVFITTILVFVFFEAGSHCNYGQFLINEDSVLYYQRTVNLQGVSCTKKGRKSSDTKNITFRTFTAQINPSITMRSELDFSHPDKYYLLTLYEFKNLISNDNGHSEAILNYNQNFFDSSCNLIKENNAKRSKTVSFNCESEFALYFIEVKWLREKLSLPKTKKLPSSGYIKCLLPVNRDRKE
jgi:hypothetical protein